MSWEHPHPEIWIFKEARAPGPPRYWKIRRCGEGFEVAPYHPADGPPSAQGPCVPLFDTLEAAQRAVEKHLRGGDVVLVSDTAHAEDSAANSDDWIIGLARRFPSLTERDAPLYPWDPVRLAQWREQLDRGCAAYWAAQFVLSVWTGLGRDFDLFAACEVWSPGDREAAAAWICRPRLA